LGRIERGAWLCDALGRLAWVGEEAALPAEAARAVESEHELGGLLATPGLIDCHTHLVYAGSRADEFERRLRGASYDDIARAGGGIRATVAATRAADDETLSRWPCGRARTLAREGVTALEIKSGYGLSLNDEARCLRVARRVGHELGRRGPHHLPGRARAAARIRGPARRLRRGAVRLAAALQGGAGRRGRRLLRASASRRADAARVRGGTRARPAGQAARRAAQRPGRRGARRGFGALSCDHLEYLGEAGVRRWPRPAPSPCCCRRLPFPAARRSRRRWPRCAMRA
jgi:imidazolonepropionase